MNPVNMASHEVEKLPSVLVGAVFVLCLMPLLLGSGRMELLLLSTTQQRAYHLHTLLEWSAFYTALCTMILGLIHYVLTRNVTVLILGAALGCAGMMDAIHILISNGLLAVAGDRPDLVPFTWTVSRYFTALLLTLGPCVVLLNQYPVGYRTKYVLLLNTVAIGGLLLGFVHLQIGTNQQAEPSMLSAIMAPPNDTVAILILFLFSLLLCHRLNSIDPNPLLHAMVISMVPQLSSQLYMVFGSKAIYDAHFYVAHALKVLAYLIPFIGMALYHIRTCQQTIQGLKPLQEEHTALLARQAELEQQNSDLHAFNYIAGHDLQEPVRKLIAFCQHLRHDIGTNFSRRAEQDLHYIVDAATRMQVLIHTLLTFSKSGQTAVKYEWLPVDDCVDEVLNILSLRLEETQATVHRDPLPVILGDRCLLTLIYQNLIENALKFVAKQPPVIRLTAEQSDDGWVLGVQDQGIGIKAEQVESIFAPFVRLHNHSEYPGAGVGLTICRMAVERQQGRIWVDTKPEQGVHFKFILGATSEIKDLLPSYQSSALVR